MDFLLKIYWHVHYFFHPAEKRTVVKQLTGASPEISWSVPAPGELCDCRVTMGFSEIACYRGISKSRCRNYGQPGTGAVGHVIPLGRCANSGS